MKDMEHIEGNSYEEYKKNLSRSRTWRENIYDGKGMLIAGTFMLLFFLYIFPFHAGNAHEIQGDQIEFGGRYDPQKVYYFDKLEILETKTDTDDDSIYCIARFSDCDQQEWIILLTPGRNEPLAENIRLFGSLQKGTEQIRLFDSPQKEGSTLPVSGYFLMRDLKELPSEAGSYLRSYGKNYAVNDGSNIISVNAEYLCSRRDNYTLQTLKRPGTPLGSLVVALSGIIYGAILLIRCRRRKKS